MILLFSGMQSSLSMVYDRETGAMRTLLVSPYPRWFLLGSKLVAGVLVSVLQVYAFLLDRLVLGGRGAAPRAMSPCCRRWCSPGIMLGSLGLLISSAIRQLENFAGVMNFVIFPMFFASTALYPLWRMRESSVLLHDICAVQPLHPCGGADPLRALCPVQPARLRRGRRLHAGLLRRRPSSCTIRPRASGGAGGEEANDPRRFCSASSAAAPAFAAGPPDPDWPCVQRRQPQLSIAQVWGGPVPDAAALALAETPEVQELAQVIALRRTPMAEAEARDRRPSPTSHDAEALVALFAATFDHINRARDRVMAGITRYAHKQEALEARIEELRHEFAALEAAEDKDFDRMDAVEKELDWSTRIFQDRQQSLTYVCETPVILEQRAFALGRAVEALLPE